MEPILKINGEIVEVAPSKKSYPAIFWFGTVVLVAILGTPVWAFFGKIAWVIFFK